jgi:hypothetical protein
VIRTNLIEDLTLVPLPPWWQSPRAIAGFVLLGAGLLLFGWLVRRWLATRPPTVPAPAPAPDRTPEFLARLAALRARRTQLTAYDLAIESSEVLREFVEWRFGLAIRFQTTREFLEAASRHAALAPPQREWLGTYLHFCDLVKFARHGASPEEEDNLLDSAEKFLQQGAAITVKS